MWSVQTSTSSDRDSGTGTWEIVSPTNHNYIGSVKDGDKIHLLNQYNKYGTKSYLDTCGHSTCSPQPISGMWSVQTSTSSDRDSGTGTWEIVLAGK